MFDSQKISFQEFISGYKHGVYVLTSDSCQACSDYKKQIIDINNYYLYFVEVTTTKEREIVNKLLNRAAFPLTVAYKDNDLQFIRAGILYDLQWTEIDKFLKQFGDAPLTDEELKERIDKIKNRCVLTYYVFPPDADANTRLKWMSKAASFNELPIDVDMTGIGLDIKERERMLEGNYLFANMVVFDDGKTNIYSDLATQVILGYSLKNKTKSFVKRSL